MEDTLPYLRRLCESLFDRSDFLECLSALKKGESVSFDGVWGSSCALAAAAVLKKCDDSLLLVVPNREDIDRVSGDLSLFSDSPQLLFLPQDNSIIKPSLGVSENAESSEETSPTIIPDDIFGSRIRVLKELLVAGNPVRKFVLIANISALLQPVPDKEILSKNTRLLKTGMFSDSSELVRWLVDGGYHNTSGVDLPGEFSVRGSIIDIYAPDWDGPVRIEFFGDELESIRRFDIATQRSRKHLDSVDLSRMNTNISFGGFLSDYLPENTLVMLSEPSEIETSGRKYLDHLGNPSHLHQVSEVLKRLLSKFPYINSASFSTSIESHSCKLPVQSVERMHGDLQTVRRELDATYDDDIHIICPTQAETKRLGETFSETKPCKEERLSFAVGNLSAGFRLKIETDTGKRGIILIGSGQLFERQEIRRTKRRHLGQVIDSFLELKCGDLVVHLSHGIGRFRGLKTLTKQQQEEEHLQIEFAESAMLYVPVSKIALVQKYVAGSKSKPKLAKLGSQMWNRSKRAVQEAVFDMAADMIELQASRESRPGIAFPEDSDWQLEFDAAFPYNETEDQFDAIEAIKHDMRRNKPMDRLICGDVGFGKTEVAMRAVFKAADAGHQVAVLVPTTILAEQHYRTFSERMREFPFRIAALSRFQKPKEQKQILEDLSIGKVDIVIGTHRIVSKDVQFHNLGLVIIDEEQRFGVGHKERLKTLRNTVDVLTLTATPIPRTLHLSLLGIRDISNLETPPEDRMAVETRLVRFDPELIRSAVMRELARDGQAFFVHNRVMDIELIAEKLHEIVPEAKIGIGHAQMPEGELEQVMREFVSHEFDLLVCTTIIESGLDIPNANTIFIDQADRYGLADLHQLRGRVGRYKNQAYCYMLIDQHKPITGDAAKRLRAIEEYSHLGAGFNLAMRDLEIRGAGNILGTQQSGHIALVGYEMYCQFLDAAVRMLKSMPPKTVIETEVDLPGTTIIPRFYVPEQRMKIDLYRRIVRAVTRNELEEMRNEIIDRFGKPPAEVERLLDVSRVRIDAHKYRIRSIRLQDGVSGDSAISGSGRYLDMEYVSENLISELKRKIKQPLRTTPDRHAFIPLPKEASDPDKILKYVRKILE